MSIRRSRGNIPSKKARSLSQSRSTTSISGDYEMMHKEPMIVKIYERATDEQLDAIVRYAHSNPAQVDQVLKHYNMDDRRMSKAIYMPPMMVDGLEQYYEENPDAEVSWIVDLLPDSEAGWVADMRSKEELAQTQDRQRIMRNVALVGTGLVLAIVTVIFGVSVAKKNKAKKNLQQLGQGNTQPIIDTTEQTLKK